MINEQFINRVIKILVEAKFEKDMSIEQKRKLRNARQGGFSSEHRTKKHLQTYGSEGHRLRPLDPKTGEPVYHGTRAGRREAKRNLMANTPEHLIRKAQQAEKSGSPSPFTQATHTPPGIQHSYRKNNKKEKPNLEGT